MPIADLNGHRIFFEDTGGDAPAIMFSHGLLMDHSMFAPQIEALRDTWRCIAWDERGHGETGQVPALSPFSYWDSAADLLALMDHLGIGSAVLVGMSQGGFLSLRAALLQPQRVRGLVLMATQAGPEEQMQIIGARALAENWLAEGPSETLIDNAERLLLGTDWPGAAVWREKWWHFSPRHFMECLNTLGEREDLTPRLGEITCPTLVIHGEADIAIPMARAEALAAGLKAPLVRVANGGHGVNLTQPAQVTRALRAFLDDLSAAAGASRPDR